MACREAMFQAIILTDILNYLKNKCLNQKKKKKNPKE